MPSSRAKRGIPDSSKAGSLVAYAPRDDTGLLGQTARSRCPRFPLPVQEPPVGQTRVAQRDRERLGEGRDRKHLDLPSDLFGEVLEVGLVLLRDDDVPDARANGPEDLLLEASARERAGGARDFS